MPDYEIKCWDESNYNIAKCAYMREAYEAKKWGFVSDYARIDILYTHGGIYMDTDVEVLRSFDPLLGLDGFCGFESGRNETVKYVNFGLCVGMEAGLEVGRLLLEDYRDRSFFKSDGSPDLTPCPVIQTRTLCELGLRAENRKQNVHALTVFPSEFFCPLNQYTYEENITKNTYSVHHYDGSWLSPANRERLSLCREYRRAGKPFPEVFATFRAYKKHYGSAKMWGEIAKKIWK